MDQVNYYQVCTVNHLVFPNQPLNKKNLKNSLGICPYNYVQVNKKQYIEKAPNRDNIVVAQKVYKTHSSIMKKQCLLKSNYSHCIYKE